MTITTNTTHSPSGFSHQLAYFEGLTALALSHANKLGASDAGATASEACGLSVSVRKGELENIERNRDKSLNVTVHLGNSTGNASTSDFSPQAIERTVQAAFDIARFTTGDECTGLPDVEDVVFYPEIDGLVHDLDLFHPWDIDSTQAMHLALTCENAAFEAAPQYITNSDGAAVSAQQSQFFSAHTHGFSAGYASSQHALSLSVIAGHGDDMQSDGWYSSECHAADLMDAVLVGKTAAQRAVQRLNPRKIPTTQCPVLFESTLASGLMGGLVAALSGGAQYRKASFLLDAAMTLVLPSHMAIHETPFLRRGKGSSPFDGEGVRVKARQVVESGVAQGYFLNSYSARKLGLRTTGNAGGAHNLSWTSSQTQTSDDLTAMLQKLGTGLFVTELMGSGVNGVTGDYSRGASGFWVENGAIAYPVHEITIAGNLKSMLLGILAVGADVHTSGSKKSGSVLVDRMVVAGS